MKNVNFFYFKFFFLQILLCFFFYSHIFTTELTMVFWSDTNEFVLTLPAFGSLIFSHWTTTLIAQRLEVLHVWGRDLQLKFMMSKDNLWDLSICGRDERRRHLSSSGTCHQVSCTYHLVLWAFGFYENFRTIIEMWQKTEKEWTRAEDLEDREKFGIHWPTKGEPLHGLARSVKHRRRRLIRLDGSGINKRHKSISTHLISLSHPSDKGCYCYNCMSPDLSHLFIAHHPTTTKATISSRTTLWNRPWPNPKRKE